ncbi:carboxylesterase type B [Melanomma pulvis-pyrius CBS 109.77]|uniref:Carboxylic ester hydrolase n=1 Tax=Melanomma pulvis-pyrius CBS 109.77 TaxID=1314802 RepID=A0A6A6X1G7_9PLEO|nr:carboxylesterase type B [Melanomma pulvis-pyrius CBS 109.77]
MPSLIFLLITFIAPLITAFPHAQPFEALKQQADKQTTSLQVDLGYAIYEGVGSNSSTGINTFKGIRFAAPPLGPLRWQAPQPPRTNRTSVISAASFGSACYQTANSGPGFGPLVKGVEDCLFLNVYAPANASKLPVLVWIHGGGYGVGDGTQNLTDIIAANENGFVGVSIQYRLGAFGFLSSDEVYRNGAVNAGLLDQLFALQWVQSYIELFGGDPSQVTISGLSAGGGSVMLLDIAYGGTLGTSLFVNSISASPFLPQQYGYKDWIPSQSYYAFATAAGCPPKWAYGNSSQTIFECLIAQDTEVLQNASSLVSGSGTFGSWAFLPVTDGTFIQETPSQALFAHKLNGLNHLSGNNAEEGFYFTAPNITTENDLLAWIHLVFPLFTANDTAQLLSYYSPSNITNLPRFASAGDSGPTALDVSQAATGPQQLAYTIYSETTFICPSYWLAEVYNNASETSVGYKYQYSVVNAAHGADTAAYFGPPTPNQGPDFVDAFQHIWGNFIRTGNPSISSSIANGAASNATAKANGLADWPPFTEEEGFKMANLNQTGGTLVPSVAGLVGSLVNIEIYTDPGLRNDLRIVDAESWEGGRGARCAFWKSVAGRVPE